MADELDIPPPMSSQTLGEIIQENIDYDKNNVFRKNMDIFPEEAREERAALVRKDEYVAAVEINGAFTLLREVRIMTQGLP
jgi:hypothetical protein